MICLTEHYSSYGVSWQVITLSTLLLNNTHRGVFQQEKLIAVSESQYFLLFKCHIILTMASYMSSTSPCTSPDFLRLPEEVPSIDSVLNINRFSIEHQ